LCGLGRGGSRGEKRKSEQKSEEASEWTHTAGNPKPDRPPCG
jgi:hypothetical protein